MRRTILASLILSTVAGPAAANLAPRLDFTADEMTLAQAVSADPDLASAYGATGLAPIFTGPGGAVRRAALRAAVAQAPAHGLPPERYRPEALAALDAATGLEAELAQARTFALWVRDVSAGVLDPKRVDPGIKRAAEGADVAALLRDFATAPDPAAVLARAAPTDPRYLRLQKELAREGGRVAPADLAPVPAGTFRAGASGPAITALRARLAAFGHAPAPEAAPETFDAPLAAAVAAFQDAAGLPSDGIAGPRTTARLNATEAPGARAILISLERFRWLPDDLGARHVWVNLPEFRARVIEATETVFDTKVVIGKTDPEMRTPEFSDVMEYVVANPRWVVPRSITVNEYLPKLQKNPGAAGHLDIFDRRGRRVDRSSIDFGRYTAASFPYTMQQRPSEDNALGIVKFIFPNPWNIYLHDTPSKSLFGEAQRTFSHGCIRVGRPVELAHELLRPQSRDPEATFAAALKGGKERFLHLDTRLPVHLVYFTLWPGAEGMQRFGDVYGRDARVWAAWRAAVEGPSPLEPRRLETVADNR